MISFYLINLKRSTSAIGILVSFRGAKYRRSVGESIPVKYWNKTKKRAKVTSEFTYGNSINDTLDKWDAAALRTLSFFKEYYNPPTSASFFAQLDKEYYKDEKEEPQPMPFTDYMRVYIDRYEKVRTGITIRKYNTALNKLLEYEKSCGKKLLFEDIDIDFYNNFHLLFYEQGYADNYFGSVIKIIKQTFTEARRVDKLHTCDGIEHKDFITVSAESDNVYFNEDELLKIHRLNLTPEFLSEKYPKLTPRRILQKIESLHRVRQRFLIGAYTGLRVSDFARLGDMNIGEFIRINALKTKSNTVVPIHPVIAEILDAGFDANISVSDQKINSHIKELARLAGITEKVLLNRHIGGKVVEIYKEKCDLVSTHTARRSFATNAYKAGVPTIAIMKMTGHKKESTFLKYIKISAEENAEMLKNHPFFAGPEVPEMNAEDEAEMIRMESNEIRMMNGELDVEK